MKYNVGLVSVSFRKNSPEEILEAMKRAELDWIEWGSDIHAPKGDPATLKHLASLQKKFGIACSSYGSYFRLGTTPLEELPSYLDAAERLGTDTVRLWCGDRDWEAYDEEEKKKLFQSCRAAGEMAKKRGITLCMECHNKTFTNCQQGASELMKTIHQESFRMYWQPNQHRSYEENLSYARELRPYIKHVHVFHWIGKEKYPLIGAVDVWRNYLDLLPAPRTLLLEFMPDDRIDSLDAEAGALRKILEESI